MKVDGLRINLRRRTSACVDPVSHIWLPERDGRRPFDMGAEDSPLVSVGATGAVVALAFSASRAQAAEPRLLVFLHVAVKQRALQGELQNALHGITVTAVGRTADFERALRAGQDAVLSLPVVLSAYGLTAKLQGIRNGSGEEKYSLLGVGATPNPARVTTVGAVDILGRDGTISFVHKLLGSKPKVERVTKVEDLLPLLQMQRVDAIVLPTRLSREVRTASRLNVAEVELPTKVALAAVALQNSTGTQILVLVSKLPSSIATMLGVDSWR